MIDPAFLNSYPAGTSAPAGADKPRLVMRRDPDARMAGSMPVWQGAQHKAALNAGPPNAPASAVPFKTALHYAGESGPQTQAAADATPATDEDFTFGDLVDIVNPLHHIPLVNVLYESVTGDTIKPAGRIIGGAVFGGFVGAAAGIANVIVEEETGQDVAGNIVAMVRDGDLPQTKPSRMSPEEQLDHAARLAFGLEEDAGALSDHAYGLQPLSPPAGAPASTPPATHTAPHTTSTQPAGALYNTPHLPRPALVNPALINPLGITESDIIPGQGGSNPFYE